MQMSQVGPATIVPLKTFETSVKPINHFSWSRWIVSKVVAAPLWWSMSKIGVVDSESGMTESKAWGYAKGDWVVMGPLQVRPSDKAIEPPKLSKFFPVCSREHYVPPCEEG